MPPPLTPLALSQAAGAAWVAALPLLAGGEPINADVAFASSLGPVRALLDPKPGTPRDVPPAEMVAALQAVMTTSVPLIAGTATPEEQDAWGAAQVALRDLLEVVEE